jgi:hypothetical protein
LFQSGGPALRPAGNAPVIEKNAAELSEAARPRLVVSGKRRPIAVFHSVKTTIGIFRPVNEALRLAIWPRRTGPTLGSGNHDIRAICLEYSIDGSIIRRRARLQSLTRQRIFRLERELERPTPA